MTEQRATQVLGASARILVVEDDPLMRTFFVEALSSEGYEVEEAEDGLSASNRLVKESYDLVLSDVNLPGLSGVELFRQSSTWSNEAAMVLITGAPRVEDAVATIKEGACDYLTKPITVDKLADCVADALAARQTQAAASSQAEESGPERHLHRLGYRFIRTLGLGAFSTVFLVERGGTQYAMKILQKLGHITPYSDLLVRFLHEGEIVSGLDHHGIVKVLECGIGPGYDFPFILMEYVDGGTLARHIQQDSLTLEEKLDVISEICDALSVVHENGILHQDVKPSNVLLTADGRAKVTDFGISRLGGLWQSDGDGPLMGSPAYMAPERAGRDETADQRADIFSLGVLCYELLTGQLPFAEKRWGSMRRQIARRRPLAPRRLGMVIEPPLEQILARMLQKMPSDRYQSAADIRADVERFRSGQWTECGPEGQAGQEFLRRLWR